MMNKFLAILSLALTIALAGCGGGDTFRINGEVEGLGTRSLKFYYYDGDRLKTGISTALDGKFQYEGRATKPVLITISTNQGIPIGHLMAENGDAINVKFFADRPMLMEISGNDPSANYAAFLKDNYQLVKNGPSDSLDLAVEKFISDNPKDLAAAMALVLHYNLKEKPVQADSLLSTLDPKAHPAQIAAGFTAMLPRLMNDSITPIEPVRMFTTGDSMTTVDPAAHSRTLLIFYASRDFYTPAVCDSLESLRKAKKEKELAILNISMARDTVAWKQPLKDTPAKGKELWMPGSVSSPAMAQFRLNALPTVMVVDSTGTVTYRGNSFDNALEYLR